ncbi:hypothetical protein U1Q18_018197 [Sarracenia purpurea var. burkii]
MENQVNLDLRSAEINPSSAVKVKHDRELRAGGLFGRKVNPEPGLEFGVEIHVLVKDRLVVRNLDVVCGGDGRNFEETNEGTVSVEDDVDVLVGFCTVGGE